MTKHFLLALLVVGCGISKPDEACDVALTKQNVTVVIPGLNQKAPGNIAALGALRRAENVRIDKGQAGGLAFRRRNGLVQVSNTAGGTGFRMVSYDGSLVVRTIYQMELYVPGRGFSRRPVSKYAITVGRSDLQVPSPGAAGASTPTQASQDIAASTTAICYAWVDENGAAQYLVRDQATGVQMVAGAAVATGATKTKIVQLGGIFYLFWKEANAIKATTIDGTTLAVAAATTVVAAGSALAGTDYDIQAGFDATHIALLYRSAAGTYVRCLLSTAFAVTTTVTDAVAANQPDVALCWISQNGFGASLYYGTLNAASGSKAQTIDKATLAITGTASEPTARVVNVDNFAGYIDGAAVLLTEYHFADASGVTHRAIEYTNGTAAVMLDAGLASRVFYVANAATALVIYNSAQAAGTVAAPQSTYFLADLVSGKGNTFAKALPGRAGLFTTFALSSAAVGADGVVHVFARNASFIDTSSGAAVTQYGTSDIAVSFLSSAVGNALAFGGVALWPGGSVVEMDGSTVEQDPIHEQGFDLKPEIPVLVEGAPASGSVPVGARSIIARWKWFDSKAQKYVSAESTPVAITTVNANSSIRASLYPPNANTQRRYVGVEILRTPLNGTGDIYYKTTPAVYQGDTATGAVLTFVDTASEATLAAGEPFTPFSAGGPLPPVAPPAMNVVIEHRNRACGINAEDPRRIECSNEYSPGNSLTWTGVIVLLAPEPLYALASMDGHLVGFAKEGVYVWSGDLPDARGEGPTLPLYTLIPSGVGTDQPRSVVKTDLGVMFYSSKRGFHLLDRSLSVNYIGGAVETSAAGQTISGATVHPTYPEVRFTSEGGTTFVLNIYWTKVAGTPIWTTFTGQPCVHSITHDGKWYLLTSDGKLLEEDLARWQDGTAINGAAFTAGSTWTRALEVADINFAGINGFGRVYEGALVAEWFASEKIKITTTLNHRRNDPSTGLPATDTPFNFDATVNPDPYVAAFQPATQKVTSMTVLIEDTAEFQTQGAEWQALNFVVGVKGGSYRQNAGHYASGGQRK